MELGNFGPRVDLDYFEVTAGSQPAIVARCEDTALRQVVCWDERGMNEYNQ